MSELCKNNIKYLIRSDLRDTGIRGRFATVNCDTTV